MKDLSDIEKQVLSNQIEYARKCWAGDDVPPTDSIEEMIKDQIKCLHEWLGDVAKVQPMPDNLAMDIRDTKTHTGDEHE